MKVYSVIVCFNPDVTAIHRMCETLVDGGANVIVVDNSENSIVDAVLSLPRCDVIALGVNTGIAHAQNVGVNYAREREADVVVLFDQDSQIDAGFLDRLTAPLRAGGLQVIAPVCTDVASGARLPSTVLNRFGFPAPVRSGPTDDLLPVDIVIASGTAATLSVFDVVGELDEEFFIDYVDTEWCLRCRSKNVTMRVAPGAVMRHAIGTSSIKCGPVTVLMHNPTRCYYQIRNCFLLLRRAHVPLLFSIRELLAVLLNRALLLWFVDNRAEYVGAYASGIYDGLRGIVGKRAD